MKKIIKIFIKILSLIVSVIDKIIITPITKVFMKTTLFFKNNTKFLERMFTNKQSLIVISLLVAILTFYIIDQKTNILIDNSAEILYNQPVTAIYNEESYVVEGLPESVDITLIGRKSDIYLAKQYPTQEVSVDLRELKPGSHKINLKYRQAVSSIQYKLDPSTATIVIYEKVSETREITYDILHKDKLNSKLDISNVQLDRSNVVIKGAEYKLSTVATVKALIDIDNLPKQTTGDITISDVSLVAYDAEGQIVDVEIVPEKISAVVTIISPTKTVPIKIVPKGDLAFGKAIKSMSPSVANITVYGTSSAINDLEYIPVEVDVTGLDTDKTYTINISKPAGIRELGTKTITIKVSLDTVETSEVKDVQIILRNLDTKYKVTALNKNDSVVTVVVKGSSSVISSLDKSTIIAYIDLSGYSVGEHEIDVEIQAEDLRLTYTPKTKKVKVRITE